MCRFIEFFAKISFRWSIKYEHNSHNGVVFDRFIFVKLTFMIVENQYDRIQSQSQALLKKKPVVNYYAIAFIANYI